MMSETDIGRNAGGSVVLGREHGVEWGRFVVDVRLEILTCRIVIDEGEECTCTDAWRR